MLSILLSLVIPALLAPFLLQKPLLASNVHQDILLHQMTPFIVLHVMLENIPTNLEVACANCVQLAHFQSPLQHHVKCVQLGHTLQLLDHCFAFLVVLENIP